MTGSDIGTNEMIPSPESAESTSGIPAVAPAAEVDGSLVGSGDPDELLERQLAAERADAEASLRTIDEDIACGNDIGDRAREIRNRLILQQKKHDDELRASALRYYKAYVAAVRASLPTSPEEATIERGVQLCRECRQWLDSITRQAEAARRELRAHQERELSARETTPQTAHESPPIDGSDSLPPLPAFAAPSTQTGVTAPSQVQRDLDGDQAVPSLADVIEGTWVVESREPYGFGVLEIKLRQRRGKRRFHARAIAGGNWETDGTWELLPDSRLVLAWQWVPQVGPYSSYLTFVSISEDHLTATSPTGGTVSWSRRK